MPIYEYACKKCGHEFEEFVRGNEQPACPACGAGRVERQMSVPAAHVAGSADRPARPAIPAASRCCGQNCGMAEWMRSGDVRSFTSAASTTSNAEPLIRRNSSCIGGMRGSGATEMAQSSPLSATNIPYFFSPLSTACTLGEKPSIG